MRLDKYLKLARLVKKRSAAQENDLDRAVGSTKDSASLRRK